MCCTCCTAPSGRGSRSGFHVHCPPGFRPSNDRKNTMKAGCLDGNCSFLPHAMPVGLPAFCTLSMVALIAWVQLKVFMWLHGDCTFNIWQPLQTSQNPALQTGDRWIQGWGFTVFQIHTGQASGSYGRRRTCWRSCSIISPWICCSACPTQPLTPCRYTPAHTPVLHSRNCCEGQAKILIT